MPQVQALEGNRHQGLRWLLATLKLHRFGVPVDDLATLDAEIAEQGGAGGTEAEGRIFDHGLSAADRLEEVVEVVVAVGVVLGRGELLNVLRERAGEMFLRILLAILVDVLLLHSFGKGGNGVAGFGFGRGTGDRDSIAADGHEAFGAGKEEALTLLAAIDEVHMQAEVEPFGVVEERE